MFVFGTRPEAIKLAPVIKEFQRNSDKFKVIVCVTGQHREMLDQVLNLFGIIPDYDLNIMKKDQDLIDITTNILLGLRKVFESIIPDFIFVHGDTTSSLATSLAAFYYKVPVCHVEAGLRTHNIHSPWPEEMNRSLTARLAWQHFSPTELSKNNLILEGIDKNSVFVTGNTVIDALFSITNKLKNNAKLRAISLTKIHEAGYKFNEINFKKVVLITGHRRENFGQGFINICKAIKKLSETYPEVDFVYPVHPNPNIKDVITQLFANNDLKNIYFIKPLDYLSFVHLMSISYIILTDSGGIQEEAPSLKIPVLVMRDTTERPEALTSGSIKLVGTNFEKIIKEVSTLLNDRNYYEQFVSVDNPYGDGSASLKILKSFIEKCQD